jgi:hypothetical protein
MANPLYLIKHDGQGSGGFLCPPGHPNLSYSVEGYYGGRVKPVSGPDLIAGLDYLIRDEYGDVPATVKAHAGQIMRDAELACSEKWLREVYGYFRNSYSPDGVNRNVSDAISSSKVHCRCGAEFWNRRGLESHLSRLTTAETYDHFEIATPKPPPEHHLGFLCVREYFPDHEIRLDLIENPAATRPGYGAHSCPKCGQKVQYEARCDAYVVVTVNIGGPWKYNAECPGGGTHD